jgi:2-polyprenyl-3-methyl-5-hydroxy-6-metoxy-1,4-benzoquinol methylase
MATKINNINHYSGTQTLEVLEGADNYNKWIYETISNEIKPPIFEIGSGIGNISCLLMKHGSILLTDIEPFFVKLLKEKYSKENIQIEVLDINKKLNNKYLGKFKSIVGINVLEHIEKDVNVLINLNSALSKDGKIILLVPAKKMAYNKLDKSLGHFRRYEKKEIIEKLETAGYEVKSIKYFNFIGLFSWILRDLITKNNFQLGKNQVKAFDIIVPILKVIENHVPIPVGISIIVVATPIRN